MGLCLKWEDGKVAIKKKEIKEKTWSQLKAVVVAVLVGWFDTDL